jgi:hypothetical protein
MSMQVAEVIVNPPRTESGTRARVRIETAPGGPSVATGRAVS